MVSANSEAMVPIVEGRGDERLDLKVECRRAFATVDRLAGGGAP